VKVAILTPGPCATLYFYEPGRYDLLIGVNRACQMAPCDFVVMRDVLLLKEVDPLGKPVMCAARINLRLMQSICPKKMRGLPMHDLPPNGELSAISALKLAVEKGGTQVDCYGMSLGGDADYDGWTHEMTNRTQKRWKMERTLLADQFRAMRNAGVKVKRILRRCDLTM